MHSQVTQVSSIVFRSIFLAPERITHLNLNSECWFCYLAFVQNEHATDLELRFEIKVTGEKKMILLALLPI